MDKDSFDKWVSSIPEHEWRMFTGLSMAQTGKDIMFLKLFNVVLTIVSVLALWLAVR